MPTVKEILYLIEACIWLKNLIYHSTFSILPPPYGLRSYTITDVRWLIRIVFPLRPFQSSRIWFQYDFLLAWSFFFCTCRELCRQTMVLFCSHAVMSAQNNVCSRCSNVTVLRNTLTTGLQWNILLWASLLCLKYHFTGLLIHKVSDDPEYSYF